jgi:hypothetical protein
LKKKEELCADPFLKAKLKYLIEKEKPNLLNKMPKMKISFNEKKNTLNVMN